jgi:hypothetical protein
MEENKIEFSMEKRVINIRRDLSGKLFVANTPDGREVYVNPQNYELDAEHGQTRYYIFIR